MPQKEKQTTDVLSEPMTAPDEFDWGEYTQKWSEDFSSLDKDAQQIWFYNMLNERLYWRLIYYMRRFPERLVSSRSTYTDRAIGFEELQTYMGFQSENSYAATWLEDNHIPPLEEARQRLILLNAQLHTLFNNASDCAIARIKRYFSLNDVEMEVLATMVAAMSVEHLMRMMTVAWADFSVRHPTVSFLGHLISDTPEGYENVLQALDENATLRRMRLVIAERHALMPNYTPLAYAPLAIEQTVIDAFNDRAHKFRCPPNITLHKTTLPLKSLVAEKATLDEFKFAIKSSDAHIALVGPAHAGRATIACAVIRHALKQNVMEIDVTREFARQTGENPEIHLAALMRDALLLGCVPMLRFDGLADANEVMQQLTDRTNQIAAIVEDFPAQILILTDNFTAFIDDIFQKPLCIHIQPPSVEVAASVWMRALAPWTEKADAQHMADTFAHNYALPIGSIFNVVHDTVEALQASGAETTIQSHNILNEIRKTFRHNLGSLAEISVSDVPLKGVVLTKDAQAQVNEILEYARNLHTVLDRWGFRQRSPYGNALSVLFSGPPGTGKTLLANALSNELGKVLYRVDLSRIVDKYIGETEKNLGRIFDEAAKAQAIILFDEADSLFAKRTEVKSSNDRYANLEINFLLQKLESYNGITILTTNLSKSIDEAFRRRIRFIIEFPMPDAAARTALWKRMLPPDAPVSEDIRWAWLAKTFEMSGGYIRNAVLKASIAAAAQKSPISMQHLAKAAADEARSMGKLMRIDDDFDDDDFDNEYTDSDDREYRD